MNEGVPTEDNVAEIFEAIIPLFPTPHIITLDLHLIILLIAFSKLKSKELFNFLSALICRSITFFPIEIILFSLF